MKQLWLSLSLLFMLSSLTAQSSITFKIKNAGFTVPGSFSAFKTEIKYDKKVPRQSYFNGSVKVKSIDTDNKARDKHLRNEDFFEVDTYPEMSFQSTAVSEVSANRLKIAGNLKIKNVSKKVVFDVKVSEKNGKTVFDTELEINRRDFEVGGSSWTLANKLTLFLHIEQ